MMRLFAATVPSLIAPLIAAASPLTLPAIPFTQAAVSSVDNRHFDLSWQAPHIAHIRIVASTDPVAADALVPVAAGTGAGAATADLPAVRRWYFDLIPDRGRDLIIADRSLHLPSASNFRDVGGYRTRGGEWVRMGVAYRSNALDHLTTPDLAVLTSLHLKWICDLRTDGERHHGADIVPPGVQDTAADVLADDAAKLHAIMAAAPAQGQTMPDPTAVAHEIYRDFVATRGARLAYHALFLRLADRANLPAVLHCSAGKDRTGWAAAVLLTILNVPHAAIVQDYVLTNTYLRGADVVRLREAIGANSVATRLALTADVSDLEAAFAEVRRRYGAFDHYLHDGLGLSDATLAAIRQNFLSG